MIKIERITLDKYHFQTSPANCAAALIKDWPSPKNELNLEAKAIRFSMTDNILSLQ